MSTFYAAKDAIDFVNPIKLEVSSPLDVRLLFETRDGLLTYDNPHALYNGIVASYKFLSYAKTDKDGNIIEEAILNDAKECFQWFETNEKTEDYGRWRQFRTLDQGAIFIMCPWGKPDKPLAGDQYSIHLTPLLDEDGNPVQTPGENGLPVWEQYVWVVYDADLTGDNKYRGVRQSDDWEKMQGKWEFCGAISLNIDTKAFPSRAEVDGKLDRGEGCAWDDFDQYDQAHQKVHKDLEDRIGTFEDFMNGFDAGAGDSKDDWASELQIKVQFDGTWGRGNAYNPDGTDQPSEQLPPEP